LKESKGIGYSIITLIILFTTQVIIRSIGIENISVQVFVGLLAIASSLVIFGTYKDGKKGFGIRYNTVVAILAVVASISVSIMFIILKGYPALMDRYGEFLVIVSLVNYFALVLFIIIYRIVYETKKY
jgi:hypothetical protein